MAAETILPRIVFAPAFRKHLLDLLRDGQTEAALKLAALTVKAGVDQRRQTAAAPSKSKREVLEVRLLDGLHQQVHARNRKRELVHER